jgi:hypothetical protein
MALRGTAATGTDGAVPSSAGAEKNQPWDARRGLEIGS